MIVQCPPNIEVVALQNIPQKVSNCAFILGKNEISDCKQNVKTYSIKISKLPTSCAKDAYNKWISFYNYQIQKAEEQQFEDDNAAKLAHQIPKP